ncbi:hypothetical protein BGP75_13285 [Motiliproteus sp. MSK22-1]|nr:hypothetical protein BGP75_13285 [Motiliproteus sp. MSK22-1]
MHIAILEPGRVLAESLMDWLEEAGHRYTCCSNLPEFMACIRQQGYDLLLVDFRCQTAACFEEIEAGVLNNDRRIPLLFISEPDCEEEIVLALAHGADDYIVKPLKPEELVSRIHVLIRRFAIVDEESRAEVQTYGPFVVDHQQLIITRDGEPVSLTGKDFRLADFLFRHQNQLLSRHRLLSEVWGVNQDVNTRTVDMHISRLRKALMLSGTGYEIQTVHQHGYRLQSNQNPPE